MDVEAECDRQFLCKKIIDSVDQQLQEHFNKSQSVVEEVISTPLGGKRAASKGPRGDAKEKATAQAVSEFTPGGTTIKIGNASINLENINITYYLCDFGNVVVGGSKKKSFRLTNVGKIPINFNFDKKMLGQAGIDIEPDKA